MSSLSLNSKKKNDEELLNSSKIFNNNNYTYSEVYSNDNYDPIDTRFPYNLKKFQANSKEIIEKGDNLIVTAHTGCGKTTVAYLTIFYILSKGLKIALTTPIKSLSNQTYSDLLKMKDKFEKYCGREINIGLLTGDIKINAKNSDIIVMTTEILRNSLQNKEKNDDQKKDKELCNSFIDGLGCWINDEAHYMGDKDRGHVWESTYILLSKLKIKNKEGELVKKNIQLVGLSATIDDKIKFANWIGKLNKRKTYIISTNKRIIPLKHYFLIKDKLHLFLDENKKFYDDSFNSFRNYKNPNSIIYTLNQAVNFLKNENLLQAIFFCYSRINCQKYAQSIEYVLNNNDERSQTINILNSKLLSKPKIYSILKSININKVSLYDLITKKGIGYHHSGLHPVIKEIIEILFKMGLIKVLFATETFAVGINMPTRTVVFTGLKKPSENGFRYLYSHEYKQQSGRSGRLGIDDVGTVILLNLYNKIPDKNIMKSIISGRNQSFKSKLKLNYDILIKIGINNNCDLNSFLKESYYEVDTFNYLKKTNDKLNEEVLYYNDLLSKKPYNNEEDILLNRYYQINNDRSIKQNKKNKMIKKLNLYKISNYENKKKYFDTNWINIQSNELLSLLKQTEYIKSSVKNIFDIKEEAFLIKGVIASQINDCNSLILSEIISQNILFNLKPEEIIGLLSIFINKKKKSSIELFQVSNENIRNKLKIINDIISNFNRIEKEINYELYNYNEEFWQIYFNDINMMYDLAKKIPIEEVSNMYEVFEGDLIKNMSKISDICNNIIYVCRLKNDLSIIPIMEKANELINPGKWIDSLYTE